jgi:hypothetical protein
MKDIDFTKYPKILPYVKDAFSNGNLRAGFNNLDEETFVSIVHEWIEKYEKDVENMIENTFWLYELTRGNTGHDTLSKNWQRIKETFPNTTNVIDRDLIRKWWREKFVSCICQLYGNFGNYETGEIKGGATGCMITCRFNVRFHESDYKHVKEIAVCDFNMCLVIDNSLHTEIDVLKL